MICDRLLSYQLRANTIRSYLIPSPIRVLSVKQARFPNTMIIRTNIFARNFKLDTKSAFLAGRFGWVVLAPD
jgi:hypothetical protein